MAQINITLNQEEILQVLTSDKEEALKLLIGRILNQIMLAESEEQLGAARHERSQLRQDYRNGTRSRNLVTRIGKIELNVPRHRNEPFHTMIFDNYQRSEAALIATMVQMVISGVSTRKVSKVVETLCGESFSKSTVSELCKCLDEEISSFKDRSLQGYECPFLILDATYFKVRENHRIVSKAFMIAVGVRDDGEREILGFDVYDNESNETWRSFVSTLKKRGLKDVHMVISDAHNSILHAVTTELPQAAWQRCQFHFTRNILDATPDKYKKGLATELREMFQCDTVEKARLKRDEILEDYMDVAAKAMEKLDLGFDDAMTVMLLPAHMRSALRTSNMIERINAELKRRSDVIRIFPNPDSILRLMGAVCMEYNDVIQSRRKAFGCVSYDEFKDKSVPELIRLANSQPALIEAA